MQKSSRATRQPGWLEWVISLPGTPHTHTHTHKHTHTHTHTHSPPRPVLCSGTVMRSLVVPGGVANREQGGMANRD